MGSTIIQMTDEQANLLSSDLAALIGKLERVSLNLDNQTIKELEQSTISLKSLIGDFSEKSQLQISLSSKIEKIISSVDTLTKNYDQTLVQNKAALNDYKGTIHGLLVEVKDTVTSVITTMQGNFKKFEKEFDTSTIEKAVNTAVNQNITRLVAGVNKSLDDAKQVIAKTEANNAHMRAIAEQNKDVVNSFNNLFDGFNKKLFFGAALGCLLTGIGVGAVGGVYITDPIAKEYLHKDLVISKIAYDEKLEELKEVYKKSSGLEKFVQDNNILVNYGTFTDTTTPFMYFKIKQLETAPNLMFDRDGNRYIAFKQK